MYITFDYGTIEKKHIDSMNFNQIGKALIAKAPELREKGRRSLIVPLEELNATAYVSYRRDEKDQSEDQIIVSSLSEGLDEDSEE